VSNFAIYKLWLCSLHIEQDITDMQYLHYINTPSTNGPQHRCWNNF